MKKAWPGISAVGAAVILFLAYRQLFPDDESAIRHEFQQLARIASALPNEAPIARLAKAQRLAGFFARDAVVTISSHGVGTLEGRDQLVQAAAVTRANLQQLRIQFPDIQVTLNPGRQSAQVDVVALAEINGDKNPEVFEFRGSLDKQDGRWFITRLDSVKNLGQ